MPSDGKCAEGTHSVAAAYRGIGGERCVLEIFNLFHCVVGLTAVAYAFWRFSTNEQNTFLLQEMRRAFKPSPYGFQRKQDDTHYEWQTMRSFVTENCKWLLLHPMLGRATAFVAPSVVPVFYATYSSLFVAFQLSWKVAVTLMCQHAVFYATTMLHIPAATYAVALLMIAMKRFVFTYVLHSVFYQYGPTSFTVSYIAFQWNILRGLSYSVDFVRAERLKPREKRRRLPPYWKSLAYVLYLPTVVLGPPQNYDDYVAQLDKKRPKCTPREVAYCVTRLLRSAAHFVLMEAMTHYLYSSAMAKWPWMIEQLDAASLVGFVMACHFFFYVRHVFTYGFATALARAEAIEIPPQPKCIARISTCSQFWRYFDRGMHLLIRKYFYEPLVGSKKELARLVLGTAVAFAFTWYWHDMENEVAIWCALSMFGITIEVLVAEARKWAPVRKFEVRYLGIPHRLREAAALLGSPHYLLTILACLLHVVDVDVWLIVCRRVLLDFPFPLVPVLAVLYIGVHVEFYIREWEAKARKKEA